MRFRMGSAWVGTTALFMVYGGIEYGGIEYGGIEYGSIVVCWSIVSMYII